MYLSALFVTSKENYKSLKIGRKIDHGMKSFQAGIGSVRRRIKLSRKPAWYYGRHILIKSLHMLQLSEMIEQCPATFLTPFSIVQSAFHQYAVDCESAVQPSSSGSTVLQ